MVERPIKKSERQTVAASDDVVKAPVETVSITTEGASSIDQSLDEPNVTRPLLAKDKTKGNDQKKQQKDQPSSIERANPALVRGPKPTKPKPLVKSDKEVTDSNTTTTTDEGQQSEI